MEVGGQEHVSQFGKVTVFGVVDLNHTPWVLTATNTTTLDDNFLFTADDGEW
jgi:hypothetical protein